MPYIGDPPVCTCHRSAICMIHAPSGAPLSSDKHLTSLYIIVDVEVEQVELHPLEEFLKVENTEILSTIYKTLEEARVAALALTQEYLEKHGDPYDEVDDEEFIYFWLNEFGDYIGIKEMKLK